MDRTMTVHLCPTPEQARILKATLPVSNHSSTPAQGLTMLLGSVELALAAPASHEQASLM